METAEVWRVEPSAAGDRLDVHLAAHYGIARNRAQGWIRSARVTVDGKTGKTGMSLAGGEEISCLPLPRVDESRVEAEDGRLDVFYEDDQILAVDKPAGLAVHPGAGRTDGTLVNRLIHHYPEIASVGGSGRPGVVHRLDMDTTGILLIARTQGAYEALSTGFAERTIDKKYLGVTYGAPTGSEGTIDRPIGRHPSRRKEMTVREDGRPAVTHYRTVSETSGVALLELDLETGRTHQIRVHLKAVGHPLIGDPVYGEARWKALPTARRRTLREFPRPALHAWRIGLFHPRTGARLELEAPVPSDLRQLWLDATGCDLPSLGDRSPERSP